LRTGDPSESDVRRLCAVTQLTNDERRQVIEGFQQRIAEGIPLDSEWRKKLSEAGAPQLPDNPTTAQLDAWIELSELLADESFVERQRKSAQEAAEAKLDMLKLRAANFEAARAAAEARTSGASPGSEAARAVVEGFVAGIAAAGDKPVDERLRRGIYERYLAFDPRHPRYWELLAIVSGRPTMPGTVADWLFVAEAVKIHLAPRNAA
jgi:hypothetical protein